MKTPSSPTAERSAESPVGRAISSVVELLTLNAKLLAVEANASAHSLKIAAAVGAAAAVALLSAGPLLFLALAAWLRTAQGWEAAPALVFSALIALAFATVCGAVAWRYAKQTAGCVALSFGELAENLRALAGQSSESAPTPPHRH
ncbi:hypothetical protein Pla108_16050 [Botrimarina colliarenosi]|uniref:Phage holin family protein n=1 Tax=Botrimarina colliarenosi TaxID=2528001 RepID=A0A5C6AKV5_9BACT|nr:phage holin family protein [Botrimarina colliarenosi]TWU00653.1 hypothetical protein Pla108_16050 [Botrimarina colliarenosi]